MCEYKAWLLNKDQIKFKKIILNTYQMHMKIHDTIIGVYKLLLYLHLTV